MGRMRDIEGGDQGDARAAPDDALARYDSAVACEAKAAAVHAAAERAVHVAVRAEREARELMQAARMARLQRADELRGERAPTKARAMTLSEADAVAAKLVRAHGML